MRRTTVHAFLFAFLASVAPLAAQPSPAKLPDLFHKAKEQVKLGSYQDALGTLQMIDDASRHPGLEKDREALSPALAFYRGVCEAALGHEEEAREQFMIYLQAVPNARLDPAMYPKRVLATFEAAQKGAADPAGSAKTSTTTGIAAAYQTFKVAEYKSQAADLEDWADGPVRFLLTASQADEYRHLPDSIARSEYVTAFWKARDPKPETPENEFRDEFERRVAFADQYFHQGEVRGSFTDRGTVFVLLGPPSHSSMRPLKTGDDSADPAALHRFTNNQIIVLSAGGSRASQIARIDSMAGPGNDMIQPSANWREVWRYMRKNLPGGLPYEFVDFDFITRPGYGEAVLQRDEPALDAMDRARTSLPKP